MKQLLTLQDCIECGDCCYYYKHYRHLAPVLDKKEAKGMDKEKLIDKKTHFLIKCPTKKNNNYYFCAFKDRNKCSLMEKRPFDCKLYPFNVMKDRKGNIVLGIDKGCKGLKRKTKEQINEYVQYLVPLVKKTIKTKPFYIEPYQGEIKILREL